ncbi:MAG: ATP-binding protein [Sulfurimonas sp.]|jgi:signal transduction histidine kinase
MKTIHEKINIDHLIDLLNHTDSLLSYVDTEYIYRAANDAYKRKYNKTIDEIVGHTVWDVMGKDIFEKIIQPNLQKAFLGETIQYESWFEFENLPRSYLIVNYNPSYGSDSKVCGVVVSALDYTNFKALEEEKEEQDQIIREVSKMAQLGEMVSLISHQWRHPLNTLASYMLKLRQLTSNNSNTIEAIERCENILEELSSHVESINTLYSSNIQPFAGNLQNIFDSILILVQDRIHSLGIQITINCSFVTMTAGYRDEIMHILLVIIENAIDSVGASNEVNKKITITCQSEDQNILVDIHDNGDGISCEYSKLIFNPGFTTKKPSGRGYGLYFARKLLTEKVNGTIEICSDPKQGVCFRLKIPKANFHCPLSITSGKIQGSSL